MNLADLFIQLVQIPSPSGHEGQIREFVKNFCKQRGITLQQDDYGNLLFANPGSKLLLTAHMDTVQGDSVVRTTVRDGVVRSSGDSILGADDKAGFSVILSIVDQYHEKGQTPDFELLFTVEEELGIRGVKHVPFAKVHSKLGVSFDKHNVDFGKIVASAPFGTNVNIIITGKAAHSALPENAVNALAIAGEVITKLPLGGKNNETTFNLGLIKGGLSTNTIPEVVEMQGDIRSHDKQQLDDLISQIDQVLTSVTDKYKAKYRLETEHVIDGYRFDKADKFVTQVKQAIEATGTTPELIKTAGGSDANILNQHGIKTVVISSGAKNCHTNEEEIAVADLEKLRQVAVTLLNQLKTCN